MKTKGSLYHLGIAPTSRAKCKRCRGVVPKGAVRLVVTAFVTRCATTRFSRCLRCFDAPLAAAVSTACGGTQRLMAAPEVDPVVAEGVRAPVHPDRKVATTRETKRRRLREWVAISALHPVPPPPPASWLSMVRPGDVLDGLHEGGWWEVAVKAVGSGSDSPSSSSPPPSASASGGADGIDGNTPPGQSSVTPFVVEMAARNGLVCTLKGAQLRPWIGSRFYA